MKKINVLNTVVSFIKNNKALSGILLLALLLRAYKPLELFMYSHDQDLLSWFVKDVVVNRNFRLIGQETSVHGVFIGPLWYYLAIPFYLLFNMHPEGGLLLAITVGVLAVASIYYVFTKVVNKHVGLIGALLYAVSFYSVLTDREVVPTTPTILWSVWSFFALHLFLQKKYKWALLITGILVGLIWHINMGLVLIIPLLAISYFRSLISEKSIKKHFVSHAKSYLFAALGAVVLLSPYLLFELRHSFVQTKSIVTSSGTAATQTFLEKLDRTTTLASKNIVGFTWGPYIDLPNRYPLYLLIGLLLLLVVKKHISKTMGFFIGAWITLFIVFFSYNSLNLSEYYLNGMLVVQLFVLSVGVAALFKQKYTKVLAAFILVAFVVLNMNRLFTIPINRSGFVDRTALVQFIKQDAATRGYPCVSISYITEPGFNLGYRYLFFVEGMHVNQPSSLAPVYTVAFPHSRVDKIDKSFGALGLIYPDYKIYTKEGVAKSCEGENGNLIDPLFGYVQ